VKTMYDDVPVQFRRDLTQEEVDFIAERLLAVIESFPVKPRYRGSPKWGVRKRAKRGIGRDPYDDERIRPEV